MATHTPQPQGLASNGGDPHVLLVPYPAQGHMLPLLDLAALLAARGLAVTVAVTSGNASLLAPLLRACPSAAVLALPFPPSSQLLPPGSGENTKDLPRHLFRPFMASLAALGPPLLAWCHAQSRHGRRVTAVVSDFFTGWTQPLARDLRVPHVTFSPSSALHLAMSHALWRSPPTRHLDDEAVTFPEVPGSPTFPWRHLSGLFRQYAAGDEVSEAIRQLFLWNLGSDCFVANTFAALEADCVTRPLPDLASKRVFAVGPLSDASASADRGGEPAVAAARVSAWLDAFPDGSVVYVSFGTQAALSAAQAASVAEALARSSAAFVWAARAGTAVPEGFEARTAPRGLVIRGWAPQVEVLRHRAVGWFLTHCGWNSVLEAAAAGVAMLAWPMGADQFTDARLLAEAGVAVPVAEGADAVPDAGAMAAAIAKAVGNEWGAVRERAGELGRMAAAAVAEGGSSHRDLEEFVQMLLTASFHC